MSHFSTASRAKLSTCDERLVELFCGVVLVYDCTILEGARSQERQDELFRTGQSQVEWPNSRHNVYGRPVTDREIAAALALGPLPRLSQAVDVAPYPIDWNNTKRFYHFAGLVQGHAEGQGIQIRWGGDWDSDRDLDDQTFMDLVHFELVE